MKIMLKFAVLFVTLLLLTGVGFAANCWDSCYEVTVTDLDDPTNTHTACVGLKFCDDNTGAMASPFGKDMSLFFDSMKDQALGYDPSNPSCVGYFKFHGDDLYILKGIGYCEGERHTIKGHQKDCCNGG